VPVLRISRSGTAGCSSSTKNGISDFYAAAVRSQGLRSSAITRPTFQSGASELTTQAFRVPSGVSLGARRGIPF
jgi:hypothetical protein